MKSRAKDHRFPAFSAALAVLGFHAAFIARGDDAPGGPAAPATDSQQTLASGASDSRTSPGLPLAGANWSTLQARKDWILGLATWPAPSPHRKFGMSCNLAAFCKHDKGTCQSDLAAAKTTEILDNLRTKEDLSDTSFYPLGVVRAIHQFSDRFTPAQLEKIRTDAQRMYHWNGYGGGTENHFLTRLSNGYLMAQKFRTSPGLWHHSYSFNGQKTAAQLMAMNKEHLREAGRNRYGDSFYEASSPNYTPTHLVPLLNLYDFAEDVEVKRIAEAMLTHMLAHLSVNVYRGYIVDSYQRFYNSVYTNGGVGPGPDDGNKNTGVLVNWLYWNQAVPEETRFTTWGDNMFMVYPALSSYNPFAALERIANLSSDHPGKAHWVKTSEPERPANMPWQDRIPGAGRRRVWRDKEFAVGSIVGYFLPASFYIQSGSKLGIAYRSTDRLHYIQAGHPYWLSDAPGLDWWQAPHSPFMQVAHHKDAPNTAIVMFNIPQIDPWPNAAAPKRPDYYVTDLTKKPPQYRRNGHANRLRTECAMRYPLTMDAAIEVPNADGTKWYFLNESETYIGIRTLTSPGTPQVYAGVWKSVFATAVLHGGRSQSGFVVEIGTSTASGGQFASFNAFQASLTDRQPIVTWGSASPSLVVEYANSQERTLRAEYDTNLGSDDEGKVRMFPNVWVDGVPDVSDPWPDIDARLDAPHPVVTLASRILTIVDPVTGDVERIDWSGDLPVASREDGLRDR